MSPVSLSLSRGLPGVRCVTISLVCVPQWDALNTAIDGGWGDSAELEPEEQRAQMIEMIVDLFTMSTSLASWPSRLSIDCTRHCRIAHVIRRATN